VDENIRGLSDAEFISPEMKVDILHRNAKKLWKGKMSGFEDFDSKVAATT
jgi:hypothetical protein